MPKKTSLGIAGAVVSDSQPLPTKAKGKRSSDDYIQLSVLIPKEMKWKLKAAALDDRVDVSSLVESLIKAELERRDKVKS